MDRFYRGMCTTPATGCFSFRILVQESDLFFVCDADVEHLARLAVASSRTAIEAHIAEDPEFGRSLVPVSVPPRAPSIVQEMASAASLYNVGPMAAVAGAVAQQAGQALEDYCSHLVIENGGDIYVKTREPLTIAVYAGEASPFTGKLSFRVQPEGKPLGICTSSATVGPSLSFGHADAVVTVADRAEVADAAATAIGNRILLPSDIESVMDDECARGFLKGLIICIGDRMGAWGDLVLV